MALTKKMRVELIQVTALFPADVTLPRVALAVASLVKEVKCLVWECDAAVCALKPKDPLLRPAGAGRFPAVRSVRVNVRVDGVRVACCPVVVVRREFPSQVVPEEGLQGGDFDERRKAKAVARTCTSVLGAVAARLLFYRDQGDRRGDSFLACPHVPAGINRQLIQTARRCIAITISTLRTIRAVSVERRRARIPVIRRLFRIRYGNLDMRRQEVHRRRCVVRGPISGTVAAVGERRRGHCFPGATAVHYRAGAVRPRVVQVDSVSGRKAVVVCL